MTAREMPAITSSAHSHSTYNAQQLAMPMQAVSRDYHGDAFSRSPLDGNFQAAVAGALAHAAGVNTMPAANIPRRLVQIYIADTDQSVPLKDCLIYSSGEPFVTDMTDQELYFDIELRSVLEAHNVKRVKLYDKSVTARNVNLEPARIRDLKMSVVTLATF